MGFLADGADNPISNPRRSSNHAPSFVVYCPRRSLLGVRVTSVPCLLESFSQRILVGHRRAKSEVGERVELGERWDFYYCIVVPDRINPKQALDQKVSNENVFLRIDPNWRLWSINPFSILGLIPLVTRVEERYGSFCKWRYISEAETTEKVARYWLTRTLKIRNF